MGSFQPAYVVVLIELLCVGTSLFLRAECAQSLSIPLCVIIKKLKVIVQNGIIISTDEVDRKQNAHYRHCTPACETLSPRLCINQAFELCHQSPTGSSLWLRAEDLSAGATGEKEKRKLTSSDFREEQIIPIDYSARDQSSN